MTLYEGKRDAFAAKVDDYKSKVTTVDKEIAELEAAVNLNVRIQKAVAAKPLLAGFVRL